MSGNEYPPEKHRSRFYSEATKPAKSLARPVHTAAKLTNGQASRRRRRKQVIRFAKTWALINIYAIFLSLVAFGLGAFSSPLNAATSAWHKDTARAVFDLAAWLLICAIANRHFSLVYAKVMRQPAIVFLLGFITVGVLIIYSVCIYDIHSDARSNTTPWPPFTTRTSATIARHYTYLALVVVFPIPIKYMVMRLAATEPTLLPPQRPTVLFAIGVAAAIAYWTSYLAATSLQSIMAMGVSFCLAVTAIGIMAYMTYKGGKAYHRNFAFSAGMYYAFHLSRGLNRLLYIVISTQIGQKNISWVIFAYRTAFGILVQTLDDILEPAFGTPIVWLNFFGRIGESIASTIAFMDYSTFPDDLYLYFLLNFLILVPKDAGITDDLRFWFLNKYSIFHGVFAAKRSRATHQQHASSSGVLLGMSSLAFSHSEPMSSSDSFSTMASEGQVDRGTADSSGDAWIRSKGSFSTSLAGPRASVGGQSSVAKVSSTTESESTGTVQAFSVPLATWPYTSHELDVMRLDIKVQVSRSEQTFMGRTAAILSFYAVYNLAQWLGYSIPGKVRLHQRHEEVTWTLLVLLVEVLVGRLIASWILTWKTTRLQFVYHEAGRAARRIVSESVRPSNYMSGAASSVQQLPTPAASAASEAAIPAQHSPQQAPTTPHRAHAHVHAPPIIRLWSTTLPTDSTYRQVVLLGTGLVICVTLGPWVT
ncbi:hypothetical protein BCR44DRAFT_390508 [Catenaria anguillulae PL171]|uniref:Uncharacterized protein n=1 Tax=Catenaria anguillulae PL171 TaxID=765915 RepID=A0A1Y2HWB7_9FUNG|nr:hypothetical protein BCR44DRAFT_390508 [Catenaria anguillulae PL171]